jgi:ferredoxin
MATGPTEHDDPFEIRWDVLQSESDEQDKETTPTEERAGELPVELPPPGGEISPADQDASRVLNELLSFHYYGTRETEAEPSAARLVPALLHRYQDLSRVRYEYPLCLVEDSGDVPAMSLSRIFDEVAEQTADEVEAADRAKHHLLQLEYTIRSFSTDGASARKGRAGRVSRLGRLSDLWDRATEELLASEKISEEKAALLRSDLERARKVLSVDGDVIPCGSDTPARLFAASVATFWRGRNRGWLEDLDVVVRGLEDILAADYDRSDASKSAEHLKESAGTPTEDELDFDAMSKILSESHVGTSLPKERRDRIQATLHAIRRVRPLYSDLSGGNDEALPFPLETVVNDCGLAVEQYRARMDVMAGFFKSVRIARLEIGNHYRPESHDSFFENFDATRLTEEEITHCPPVLLQLDRRFFAKRGKSALLDLFESGIPVKVLAELDDLTGRDDAGNPTASPGWSARIGSIAMSLGHVYVMQSAVSLPSYIQDSLMAGLSYTGPALFSVYSGNSEHQPGFPSYLVAAAATESRVFPSFSFDPGRGETFRERFDVTGNPQKDAAWARESFEYLTGVDQKSAELTFTPADFLLTDSRFGGQFWQVQQSHWQNEMMPLGDYLQSDPDTVERKVPYVTAVAEDNSVVRVVVTRKLLSAVDRAADHWRGLQELGGIDNSHALAALAGEKARLEEEKRLEVEEIEKKYSTELDRDIGALSEEIIRRIAGQLIAGGAASPAPTMSFPATLPSATAPTQAPAPQEAAGEAVEEEEEEAVSFDDPYIDTPLCTSCNDCTAINSQLFAYNENKQAFIRDASAGSFKDLVLAAEKCPVKIIHPGKPKNPNETDLDALIDRAARFN